MDGRRKDRQIEAAEIEKTVASIPAMRSVINPPVFELCEWPCEARIEECEEGRKRAKMAKGSKKSFLLPFAIFALFLRTRRQRLKESGILPRTIGEIGNGEQIYLDARVETP